MKAYKGFNKDLTCTMGKGRYQYEVGKTYKEDSAKCASTGFHCVEEPIEVLSWYRHEDSRYCMVESAGDIHEDGNDKISCTEMTILKELTLEQIGALECLWLKEHPDRIMSGLVNTNVGGPGNFKIVLVRGKHPKAKGNLGTTIFLMKEAPHTKQIVEIGAYKIDGEEMLPDTYYGIDGRKVIERRRKSCKKIN